MEAFQRSTERKKQLERDAKILEFQERKRSSHNTSRSPVRSSPLQTMPSGRKEEQTAKLKREIQSGQIDLMGFKEFKKKGRYKHQRAQDSQLTQRQKTAENKIYQKRSTPGPTKNYKTERDKKNNQSVTLLPNIIDKISAHIEQS